MKRTKRTIDFFYISSRETMKTKQQHTRQQQQQLQPTHSARVISSTPADNHSIRWAAHPLAHSAIAHSPGEHAALLVTNRPARSPDIKYDSKFCSTSAGSSRLAAGNRVGRVDNSMTSSDDTAGRGRAGAGAVTAAPLVSELPASPGPESLMCPLVVLE